jgi:mono/diheme cytochrome c family protein
MKMWMMLLSSVLVLAACKPTTPAAPLRPAADPALLARGEALFKQHCSACHGDRAQGAFNWQKPGSDGKYPAPPLDGSAHAWHHPTVALKDVIRHGTQRIGGSMPPWRDKLAEADIEAVIAWFQSLWPDEIYHAWADIDRRARAGAH